MGDAVGAFLSMVGLFGGISLLVWTSTKAKIERIKAERQMWQPQAPLPHNDAVLTELRSLKQQVAEMQSTGHQFDLSFDAALGRLEGRVAQVEARQGAPVTVAPSAEPHEPLRNGLR